LAIAFAAGGLHHFYLTWPLLAWLTFWQVRIAQAICGALLGGLSAYWIRSTTIIAIASTLGIVTGGTWTELTFPNDAPRNVLGSFLMWGQLFWFDAALMVAATGLAAAVRHRFGRV